MKSTHAVTRSIMGLVCWAGLALAGCARPPAPTPSPQATPVAAPMSTPAPAATATPPSPTATAGPTRTSAPLSSPVPLQIEPIANPFECRHLPPGEPIAQAGDVFARQGGLFFMQVATGEVEAWTLPGAENAEYDTSPDNRWLVAYTPEATFLADCHSDAAYRWSPLSTYVDSPRLLAAQGDYLLFLDRGQVWIAGPGQSQPVTLPIRSAGLDAPRCTISPDGHAAAILNERTLYLVQLESAACRTIAQVADGALGSIGTIWMSAGRGGAETVVAAELSQGTGSKRKTAYRIERYSWQGERLGEMTLACWSAVCPLSPDGRWVAWEERVSDLTQAVVVADATTLAPRFRVLSARLCFHDHGSGEWLADSSGLIVRTSAGYRIVPLDGELAAAPTLAPVAGEPAWYPDELLPAPDRSDLFAIGRREVVDAEGRTVAAAALRSDTVSPADLDPWGLDSRELRFALPHLGHGGHCEDGEDILLGARVEWPPFGPLALALGLPAGDCADLRAEPGEGGQVVACLAGGTRLSPAPSTEPFRSGDDVSYVSPVIAYAHGLWLRVRAPDGQEGWVDAQAGQIGWAP